MKALAIIELGLICFMLGYGASIVDEKSDTEGFFVILGVVLLFVCTVILTISFLVPELSHAT